MIPPFSYCQLDKIAQQNAGPLPETYWLRGRVVYPPRVGKTILVLRTERCGREPGEPDVVKLEGEFESSVVVDVSEGADGVVTCRTQNSVWAITPLPEPS